MVQIYYKTFAHKSWHKTSKYQGNLFFLTTDKIDQITNNRIVSKNKSLTKEITIVDPLGLVIRYRGEPPYRIPGIITGHHPGKEDRIIFLLNKKLHLNITFYRIHFGLWHLHTCSVGEVRVVSHPKDKQVFRYCGIHSNMINYPQNRKVTMFVPTLDWNLRERTGSFNVTALYYVIDIKRVVTFQKYRPFWRNLMWYLYLVPKDIRVMKFALRTKKYQYFIIKFINDSELIVELFDGPGTYSANIFKKSYELHVTSTFQSIIYMWITSIKINQDCGFIFLTDSSSVKMNIQVNDSLQYITSHAFQKYEVFKIFSYYNVNLTVINLTCIGFNDPLCTFAGITAYSLNNESYKEITTEWHSFNSIFASRDVYSKSNETLLIFYSYKEYGNLSLTMQLSKTKCKPVIINTCALSYLCKFQNNVMCRKHQEQMKSLNLNYTEISTDFPISVNPGQCFILQMVAVVDKISVAGLASDCKINFHHIYILDRNIDIHFNIKAFIRSKYTIM